MLQDILSHRQILNTKIIIIELPCQNYRLFKLYFLFIYYPRY
jgi:hypothetical protein